MTTPPLPARFAILVLTVSSGAWSQGLSPRAVATLDEARHQTLQEAGLGHLSDEDGRRVATLVGKQSVQYEQRLDAFRSAAEYVRLEGFEQCWLTRARIDGREVIILGRSPDPRFYTVLPDFETGLRNWRDGLHFAKKNSFRGLNALILSDGSVYKFPTVANWTPLPYR